MLKSQNKSSCKTIRLPQSETATGSEKSLTNLFSFDIEFQSQADIFHPYEKHHSTVKDACQLAEELKVENLLLYHTEDKNIAQRKELYHNEGKEYFNGNILIPDDLESFEL